MKEAPDGRSVHPAANVFPMMRPGKFANLKANIAENGLLEPVWLMPDGAILDGRNRYLACLELDVEVRTRTYKGDDPLAFVLALNLERRQLTTDQRAAVAVNVITYKDKERARNRRLANLKQGDEAPERQKIAVREEGRVKEKAAEKTGSNREYVRVANKLKDSAPDVFERMQQGVYGSMATAKKVAKEPRQVREQIHELLEREYDDPKRALNAVKKAQREIREKEREEEAKKGEALDTVTVDGEPVNVEPGTWYRLGRHLLYCGNSADGAFRERAKGAKVAFADPPYNLGVAEWDKDFKWTHDYLTDVAEYVWVTPGINNIMDFGRLTAMPYKWSVACWVKNGMTYGGIGYGNWIYVALFAKGSVKKEGQQDHFRVTIKTSKTEETRHRGRKPAALVMKCLKVYAEEGDRVIDPFLGSGQTLLVAEELGMCCVGAEIEPEFCTEIISRWQALTGKAPKAVALDAAADA